MLLCLCAKTRWYSAVRRVHTLQLRPHGGDLQKLRFALVAGASDLDIASAYRWRRGKLLKHQTLA